MGQFICKLIILSIKLPIFPKCVYLLVNLFVNFERNLFMTKNLTSMLVQYIYCQFNCQFLLF